MSLTDLELHFIKEARGDGSPKNSGLVDITCFLARHEQDPRGLIDLVLWAEQRELTLEQAEKVIRPRQDRRSVFFGCGDCDQFHELMEHHRDKLDGRPHVLADNGGAILLDSRVRVMPGFNTSQYWLTRICQSVDMKLTLLPEVEDPEVYPYMHLACGQARELKKMAWDSVISACYGKRALKRISRLRQEARQKGFDQGRPFKIGLLNHIDYGDGRKRTYIVRRHNILPIAVRYAQLHQRQEESLRNIVIANA